MLTGQKSIITVQRIRENKGIIFIGRRNVYFIQQITVAIKSGFEHYTNKKIRKNTNENNLFWIKNRKPKNEVSYSKSLAKMKY